jgi:hypothetical protein
MLTVIYCEEVLFDLTPPTLFYRGSNDGFTVLATAIEQMLRDQQELRVNHIPSVMIQGTAKQILYRPFDQHLVSLETSDSIVTDLSATDWQELVRQLRNLVESTGSQTYFLELEGHIDQVNVVFES